MPKKKNLHILKITLYVLLGVCCLWAGILYSRFERGWFGAITGLLRSQILGNSAEKNAPVPVTLSPEKISLRITQLEKEILEETNDPERALELRRELQKMREELTNTQ